MNSVGWTLKSDLPTVASNAWDLVRQPFFVGVTVNTTDGSVCHILCCLRKQSMYSSRGSLDFTRLVHSYHEATSIIVRKPIYPSLLCCIVGSGSALWEIIPSRLDGLLT